MGGFWLLDRLNRDLAAAGKQRTRQKAKRKKAVAEARAVEYARVREQGARKAWQEFADEHLEEVYAAARTKRVKPRAATENAKRQARTIKGYDSDRTRDLYRKAPWRSQLCFSRGVWWGMYGHEGGYICLSEAGNYVREVFTIPASSGPSARDATWDRVVAWAKQMDGL